MLIAVERNLKIKLAVLFTSVSLIFSSGGLATRCTVNADYVGAEPTLRAKASGVGRYCREQAGNLRRAERLPSE